MGGEVQSGAERKLHNTQGSIFVSKMRWLDDYRVLNKATQRKQEYMNDCAWVYYITTEIVIAAHPEVHTSTLSQIDNLRLNLQ
jgi:hypothetical protein